MAGVCQGGTLVQYEGYEGKLRLLEIAQVPKERVSRFYTVTESTLFH